jgi:exodeoxyribonuclease VII large subunit
MAMQSSAEQPIPVRAVSEAVAGWIAKLGTIWVEGQLAQISRRPGSQMVYLVLRDPSADVSVQVTTFRRVFDAVVPPLTEGARVVVFGKPDFYVPRSSFSIRAEEIRQVGLGELLARLEMLKQKLGAEGLFDPRRKKPLPFLPHCVGLITGRASAAERDVLENARRRWPGVQFRVVNTDVQGPKAVPQILPALARLDADPEVDVIIVARGGGSVEDLLPFSDEGLLRAVFAARTPVVSAIGHEQDGPLLDLVADVRASTPTDAAKLVVPDVSEELARVEHLRHRGRQVLAAWLAREQHSLHAVTARPSLADPGSDLARRRHDVVALRERARRTVHYQLDRAGNDLTHQLARVRGMSPLATLRRGYAVVLDSHGRVVTCWDQASPGESLHVRVAEGRLDVVVTAVEEGDDAHTAAAGRTTDD